MTPNRTVTNSGCPSSSSSGLGLYPEPLSTTFSGSSLLPGPEVHKPGLNGILLLKKPHALSKTRPRDQQGCLMFTPFPMHRPACPHVQTRCLPSVSPAEPPSAVLWGLALWLTPAPGSVLLLLRQPPSCPPGVGGPLCREPHLCLPQGRDKDRSPRPPPGGGGGAHTQASSSCGGLLQTCA